MHWKNDEWLWRQNIPSYEMHQFLGWNFSFGSNLHTVIVCWSMQSDFHDCTSFKWFLFWIRLIVEIFLRARTGSMSMAKTLEAKSWNKSFNFYSCIFNRSVSFGLLFVGSAKEVNRRTILKNMAVMSSTENFFEMIFFR